MCEGVMVVIKYNYRFLQLTIAKSPVCDSEEFVVTIEEKGLLLDWVATGTENHHAQSPSPKQKDAMDVFLLHLQPN